MRAIVLVVLGLAACQPGRSAVFVTVGADPPVAGVRALLVVVEKDGRASQPEALAMPEGVEAIPPEQTFTLTLGREHDGSALLRVAALDANGATIVEGTAPITLPPGEPTTARVTLGVDVPIPGSDGGTDDMRHGGVTVTGVARLIGLTDHSGVTATLTPGGYTTTTLADGSRRQLHLRQHPRRHLRPHLREGPVLGARPRLPGHRHRLGPDDRRRPRPRIPSRNPPRHPARHHSESVLSAGSQTDQWRMAGHVGSQNGHCRAPLSGAGAR